MALAETADRLNRLQKERPGWKIWRANRSGEPGSWMATRRRDRTPAEQTAGCDPTLMADDEPSLRGLLIEQDRREEKAANR